MKKSDTHELVIKRRIAKGDKEAGKLLLSLIMKTPKTDDLVPEEDEALIRNAVRKIIKEDPVFALEVVMRPSGTTGLTLRGVAEVLDAVVGQIEDPVVAREVIDATINRNRQVEILRARGDLPSSAADVVDQTVILSTIITDIHNEENFEQMFWLRAWAHKLKDREDWDEILEMEVGNTTIKGLLVIAITLEGKLGANWSIEDITGDAFDEVGIDFAEGFDLLNEMIENQTLPEVTAIELERIKRNMAEKSEAAEKAPLTVAEEVAAVTAATVEDDEFKL